MPHLYCVVVTAGRNQGLVEVEVHAVDWDVLILKLVNHSAHAVVPPRKVSK